MFNRSHVLQSLLINKRGNVAMIFALALVPMLLVAGFAIDAQLAFSKKDKIQHSIDSAVLAGARMMQTTTDEEEVKAHARNYFAAIMNNEHESLTCDTMDIELTGPEEITGTVSCYQPTTLMNLVGRDRVQINASSVATYGTGRVDVAFVFDVSGSMNTYGRIFDLKDAAEDAVETLLPEPGSPSDGDVRIAMVSYASMINAGSYFEEVTGLKRRRTYIGEDLYESEADDDDDDDDDAYRSCEWYCSAGWGRWCWEWEERCRWVTAEVTEQEKTISDTCVYERGGEHAFSNKQPKQLRDWDLLDEIESGVYNAADDSDNDDAFLTASHSVWNDYSASSRGGSWSNKGVGGCPSVGPFALSSNESQIKSYIRSLNATGGTAGHQGIAWGWYLISEEWEDVFTGDSKPLPQTEPDVTKAMIIMTDGEFNQQFFGSQGNSFDQAKDLCDAIKEDDVVVYTVAFQAPQAGKDILSYCASGPEFFFSATNGQELVESYNAIAASISDLRISF